MSTCCRDHKEAVEKSHFSCFDNCGVYINNVLPAYAAQVGRIDVLEWCEDRGLPFTKACCEGAAYGGHLDALKWLKDRNVPWDADTCLFAANSGHTHLLEWLRDENNGYGVCPWDVRTSYYAAVNGHIQTLDWATDNGCACNSQVQHFAQPFRNQT